MCINMVSSRVDSVFLNVQLLLYFELDRSSSLSFSLIHCRYFNVMLSSKNYELPAAVLLLCYLLFDVLSLAILFNVNLMTTANISTSIADHFESIIRINSLINYPARQLPNKRFCANQMVQHHHHHVYLICLQCIACFSPRLASSRLLTHFRLRDGFGLKKSVSFRFSIPSLFTYVLYMYTTLRISLLVTLLSLRLYAYCIASNGSASRSRLVIDAYGLNLNQSSYAFIGCFNGFLSLFGLIHSTTGILFLTIPSAPHTFLVPCSFYPLLEFQQI